MDTYDYVGLLLLCQQCYVFARKLIVYFFPEVLVLAAFHVKKRSL